jgi:hypothetical protein
MCLCPIIIYWRLLGLLQAFAGAAFEGEFSNAGFVEPAQAHLGHLGELLIGGSSQRSVDLLGFDEREGDTGILGGMGTREEAGVVAVHHVFAIGDEHTGIGSRLRENFHDLLEIVTKRSGEAEAFRETGGVDVHHHVHERLHFRRPTGSADVTEQLAFIAQLFEQWLHFAESRFRTADHEIEGAVARLIDAGRHAGFERFRLGFSGQFGHLHVDLGGQSGAIDEHATGCTLEEVVLLVRENVQLGLVIGDHGDHDIGEFGDLGEGGASRAANFGREFGGGAGTHVIERADGVAAFLQATGHVRTHTTDTDESNFLWHKIIQLT